MTTAATIAAIRATVWHVLLATHRRHSIATGPGLQEDGCLIVKVTRHTHHLFR
jgi:hypothetical protein